MTTTDGFKLGDIVCHKRIMEVLIDENTDRLTRIGIVVDVQEHHPTKVHPWFGDTVIVLWDDGSLDSNSSRVLVATDEKGVYL